ncbi:MAG: MBL fold metallo-hydrolase [Deltaproteobacteria bacterium]|nr:MBL fold metallo-hydrolase [Deltaproteobacteria bacterium]
MGEMDQKLGLVKLSERSYGYMQKDEGLGWSNAGVIVGADEAILIDTLFDLPLTRKMLDEIARRVGKPIKRLVNTHHNGDHFWGNQLVTGAEIIGHRLFRSEMIKMPPEMTQIIRSLPSDIPAAEMLKKAMAPFDFSGIKLTPPTLVFDHQLTLYLDDREVELIHVGPAHTSTDVIVFFPEEKVLYAGDIIFRLCTPIGWEGTYDNWIAALNRILKLRPEKIVPGHGPLCGIEGVVEMREYFMYVHSEAKRCFEREMTMTEAAKSIDPGPYANWTEPERIVSNVARAYREFRGEPYDAPVDPIELANLMAEIRQVR